MKFIVKDILEVKSGIICQQVNCQSAMNSGLAKGIRNKWPIVFKKYKDFIANFLYQDKYNRVSTKDLLGEIDLIEVEPNLYVCNLFGQEFYGYDGKRYTSYGAWEKALPELKIEAEKLNLPVYFPHGVGCVRGGANFEIISSMIEEYFPEATFCKI